MAARQPPYCSPRVDTWALGSYVVDKNCPDSCRAGGVRELGFGMVGSRAGRLYTATLRPWATM